VSGVTRPASSVPAADLDVPRDRGRDGAARPFTVGDRLFGRPRPFLDSAARVLDLADAFLD
jgi:hypothetical protein